jgi:hypothetical protein
MIVFKHSKRMIYFGVGGIHLRLTDTTKITPNTKVHFITLKRKLSLKTLFDNYIDNFPIDFVYTPSKNNCQMFVYRVLTASKLLTKSIHFSIFDKGLHKYMLTRKPKLNYLFDKFTEVEHQLTRKNKTT